jgi:enoyl-CoA hydratase
MTSTEKIIARKEHKVGWLTFNNPERRNAMSLEMWRATGEALKDFQADLAVRVVVMHGAGEKAFVSGADISQFEDQRKNAEQAELYAAASDEAKRTMVGFSKPLIAMVRGFCIGGGLGIAVNADIRIAADNAQFAIPAAKLGLAYEFNPLRRLVGLVGPAIAKEMLFTGRRFSASEALRVGLVNQVVPVAKLDQVVRDLAAEIAANAPLTVYSAKITIDEVMTEPDQRNMRRVEDSIRACFDSNDYAIGRTAFMEKRKPEFTGS